MKIQLAQLDLLAPWPQLAMRDGYHAVNVLVRLGNIPIGEITVKPTRKRIISYARLRRRIARKLAIALMKNLVREGLCAGHESLKTFLPHAWPQMSMGIAHLKKTKAYVEEYFLTSEGIASPMREWVSKAQGQQSWPMPGVTVAVCTRDRENILEECIAHLRKLDYPQFEILIVDNSRDPVPARQIADRLGVSYVRCQVPGLSRARNAAIEHAQHEWIAFTDDDCRPEANWLKELIRPTQDSNCRCVCGLVLPAQLENAAEITHEIYHGLGRGCAGKLFGRGALTSFRTHPAETWRMGAGANMLLHKEFMQQIGGFDIDLGPGPHSVGGCGEDADVFYQVLRADHTLHYTPRAIVHHRRRNSPTALRKQILRYAMGHAAYHTRCFFKYRDHRSLVQLAWHLPRSLARSLKRGITGKSKYPVSLVFLEIRGTVAGPFHYAAVKAKRFLGEWFAKPQAAKNLPPGSIEMAPPTPPAPAPHRLMYDALTGNKSHRAA